MESGGTVSDQAEPVNINLTRVVVAMSGGVDSSVAAALLRDAGYEVIGITMKLWSDKTDSTHHHPCCLSQDVNDARCVCQLLGIPHYVCSLEAEFQKYVIDYFCQEYSRGRTPNPCLACNHYMKFHFLMDKALSLDAQYLATGHYARIEHSADKYRLLESVDPSKDQSYVLYTLGQPELAHLLLPLGNSCKSEVRHLASHLGLPVASKPDSQEICFIPDGDCRSFVARRFPQTPGDIVDSRGHLLGHHTGIAGYTIGQRQGLGLASKRRLYVIDIDAQNNTLVVGGEEDIFSDTLWATRVHWVSGEAASKPVPVAAKIRYRSPKTEAVLWPQDKGVRLVFSKPQRAITPGQAVVFYQGEEVLGGGIIESAHAKIPAGF